MNTLLDLEKRLTHELLCINYPSINWIPPLKNVYDVVIIGGGMAGLAAAFGLKRLGINNIKIYDKDRIGNEGPWATYARMPALRSTKELVGPSLDLPSLTFRAWYESQYGPEGWKKLGKIPTHQWMEYLQWYRKVLALPIENEKTLHFILPENDILALKIDFETLYSRKIILATGRGGFGGFRDVSYVQNLPQGTYAHTTENIDFSALHGKKVAIIGAGASGFDAANAALIKGASVDIIVRRPHLPFINKAASLTYSGFSEGYYHLSDKERWEIMNLSYEEGTPPPYEALERVKDNKQFKVKLATHIEDIFWKDNHIHLNTTKGVFQYDFIILATGFAVQGLKQPELASFVDKIFLWKDREEIKLLDGFQSFFQSPYLGAHFQFLEKQSGLAPFLKNIYCFNYAATLSHGLLSGDIPGIGIGASRLARGIASDFFVEQSDYYINQLKHYRAPEFEESSYHFWEY